MLAKSLASEGPGRVGRRLVGQRRDFVGFARGLGQLGQCVGLVEIRQIVAELRGQTQIGIVGQASLLGLRIQDQPRQRERHERQIGHGFGPLVGQRSWRFDARPRACARALKLPGFGRSRECCVPQLKLIRHQLAAGAGVVGRGLALRQRQSLHHGQVCVPPPDERQIVCEGGFGQHALFVGAQLA